MVYGAVWPRGLELGPEPLVEPLPLLVPVLDEPLPVLDVDDDDDDDPLPLVVAPDPLDVPLLDCPDAELCPVVDAWPTCASGVPIGDVV